MNSHVRKVAGYLTVIGEELLGVEVRMRNEHLDLLMGD